MASGYLDVMAALGGDVVSEREMHIKMLQGSLLGPMADQEFAQAHTRLTTLAHTSYQGAASRV